MAREDGFFDDLARGLADGTLTRGKALRLMGAAVVGGALGSLGISGEAGADPPGCKRNGKTCTRNDLCCSGNCSGGTCQAQTTTTTTSTTSTTTTPLCGPVSGTCNGNTDCCSGRCAGGVCAPPCSGAVALSNGTCARDCSSDAAICERAGCLRCTSTEEQKSLGEAYCTNSITRGLCPNGTTAECPTGTFCGTGRTCVAVC